MKAVILAGGVGKRLEPYTTVFPKPLMPVGGKPVLEIVIRQLKAYGFNQAIIAVGHLAELIMTFLGKGEKYGVEIKYSREDQPLGTAGPLGLLKDELKETFLVMNGDVLSTIDYGKLAEYHKENKCLATVALAKRQVGIDFGIVEIDDAKNVKGYIEKPTIEHLVSMGIYIFEPEILNYIESGEKSDLPDLVHKLIDDRKTVKGYVHTDYWLDIGRPADYEKANADFEKLEESLLPK